MTRKLNFKLEGLLKFKKIKENEIKFELKNINQKLNKIKFEIIESKKNIQEFYDLCRGNVGQMKFFSHSIKIRKRDIMKKEIDLESLKKMHKKKNQSMKKILGEIRAINNLKRKKVLEHEKILEKKDHHEYEDDLRRQSYYLKINYEK